MNAQTLTELFQIGGMVQEWKRHSKPQMSMVPDKGASALAMGIVEDFIYLNCSTSTSILQVIDLFIHWEATIGNIDPG